MRLKYACFCLYIIKKPKVLQSVCILYLFSYNKAHGAFEVCVLMFIYVYVYMLMYKRPYPVCLYCFIKKRYSNKKTHAADKSYVFDVMKVVCELPETCMLCVIDR